MMKLKLCCALVLLSSTVIAGEPRMPEQMLRGKNSQYQDGFRDGFREAVRMMNGGGHGNNNGNWQREIRISRATYGASRNRCDFTQRLARSANGRSAYEFKAGNQWCGDPADGRKKIAKIEYFCRGDLKKTEVREGSSATLRCR
ncbi:hypothetical protein [Deefgea piscis]|uniref:hypothetical protein n=1 Tax=Deefgea piscis TaxID=2739061 RepID=UPI001C7FBFF8|nr:hypothetical protein [Deefgea piscis]QZA81831.1 hypothetical protein K4H25_04010 [Deefgea piscis]